MATQLLSGSPGYVYIIPAKGALTCQPPGSLLVNIGRSEDPNARVGTWGKGLPFKLDLAARLLIKAADAKRCEQRLHARFAARHLENEWYALTHADLIWLRSVTHYPTKIDADNAHEAVADAMRAKRIEKLKRRDRFAARRRRQRKEQRWLVELVEPGEVPY